MQHQMNTSTSASPITFADSLQCRPQDYYGQVRENNWSLNTDFRGYVGLRYDL